jgi:hypothetical protein
MSICCFLSTCLIAVLANHRRDSICQNRCPQLVDSQLLQLFARRRLVDSAHFFWKLWRRISSSITPRNETIASQGEQATRNDWHLWNDRWGTVNVDDVLEFNKWGNKIKAGMERDAADQYTRGPSVYLSLVLGNCRLIKLFNSSLDRFLSRIHLQGTKYSNRKSIDTTINWGNGLPRSSYNFTPYWPPHFTFPPWPTIIVDVI